MKSIFQPFKMLIIFCLYLTPIVLWSIFSFSQMPSGSHWTLFALGLLVAAFGTLALTLLNGDQPKEILIPQPILKVEKEIKLPSPVAHPEPIVKLVQDPALLEEVESLKTQISTLKTNYDAQITSESALVNPLKKTIKDLEEKLAEELAKIVKKDEKIVELEQKINELDYEIKALVDFNDEVLSMDHLALSENDASRILKKWLDAAASLNPSFDYDPEDKTVSTNLGRLIQGEASALLFLYSFKEGRALFANGHTLTLFGLTPEQFASQFHVFMPKESLEWHEAAQKIAQDKWAALTLKGSKAVMAAVNQGPLKGYSLGVIY